MIFAGSDSEMISKLAKSIAHFFVVQNITEESKEVIYAYGMELLISDVLNTIIVLLIALFSHTLPAVVVFIAVFMGLRQFVGGFHANSHLSCMFTLVMVMMVFSYGICNVSGLKLSITLDTFPTRIMKRSVRRQPLRRIFAALQQGEAHQWTSRSCGCSSNS